MPLAPQQPPLPEAGRRPIVVIGAGGIVRDAHLPAYRLAGFRVDAIMDLDRARAAELAGRFGVARVHGDLGEAISAADPATVYDVAVPASSLPEVLGRLPEGSAVLMQKPFGENLEQARALLDICRRRQLKASVNFQLRHAPCVDEARRLIASGAIGSLHDMEVRVTCCMPWEMWTFLFGAPRVEILYHSIHYVDLLRSFLGEPSGVHALTVRHPKAAAMAATRTNIAMNYGDLRRASIHTNHGHCYGPRHQESFVKWEGTRGCIVARLGLLLDYPRGLPDSLEVCSIGEDGSPGEWREHPIPGNWFPHAFIGTMSELMAHADGGPVPSTGVEDAFRTMAVVEAAYVSSSCGGTPVPS